MGKRSRVALSAVVTAVVGILFAITPWGQGLERAVGLDWLFLARGPVSPPANVAVVAFDRTTANVLDLPRRPSDWPRRWHARIISELVERAATVIVLDLAFEALGSASEDAILAATIADAGRVILFERLESTRQPITDAKGLPKGYIWSEQLLPPHPLFADGAVGHGPFPLPKLAPTVRHFWAFKPGPDVATLPAVALHAQTLDLHPTWLRLLEAAGAEGVKALPAAAAQIDSASALRALMRGHRLMFRRDRGLADRVADLVERRAVPGLSELDEEKRRSLVALARLYGGPDLHYLNFYGPPATIATVAYHDLVGPDRSGAGSDIDLRDRVVFVGSSDMTDPQHRDRFSTVFSRDDGIDLSGVEIAATAYANLVTTSSLRRLRGWDAAGVLALVGAVVGAAAAALSPPIAVPAVAVVAAAYALITREAFMGAFMGAHLWLPLTTPILVQVPLALLVGLIGQYLVTRRERQQARRAVAYFLPEPAARAMTEEGLHPRSMGREVYAVCLATDVESFTTVAEALEPPALSRLMNEYFDTLAEAVQSHGADVCEFYADSIMATWTSPRPDPSLHRRACLAALDARRVIARFNTRYAGRPLPTRIGLHTGQVSLGPAGGGGRFVYGVRGDAANAASRIENLNKLLGTVLLASAAVTDPSPDVVVRPCGVFRLAGKAEPIAIGEVLGRRGQVEPERLDLAARFAEALEAFQGERWEAAAALFEAILADHGDDGPARFYLARCRLYLMTPPDSGEAGVIRVLTK